MTFGCVRRPAFALVFHQLMTEIRKKASSCEAARSCQDSGPFALLSYKVLTLGLVLVIVIAVVTKMALSWGAEQSADNTASKTDPYRPEQPVETGNRFPTEGNFPTPVTITDRTSEASPAAADELTAMSRLALALNQAGPREQATAAALRRFASSGAMVELHGLDRQDVIGLADYLAETLSPAEVGTLLQQTLGLSPAAGLTEEDVSSSLVDIYDAIAGNRVEEVRPSVLMVTDATDADGRIMGQAHVLPAGVERVYAVFENDHALKGLDQVLAVWRNPDDDRMVFTEFEPIRQGSAYNYVWLDVESGWPQGRYRVELFHPEAQSLLLASEGFSIR